MTAEAPLAALLNLFRHNADRYGGYVSHLGIALIAFAVIGTSGYQQHLVANLAPGESLRAGAYTLVYQGLGQRLQGVSPSVYGAFLLERDGRTVATLRPGRIVYADAPQEPMNQVAIHRTVAGDVYVVLAGWDAEGRAGVEVYVNPLVSWLWVGGLLLVGGSLFALWPREEQRRLAVRPERERLFGLLKELEYDYRMQKLPASDYLEIKEEYTRRLTALLVEDESRRRRLDHLERSLRRVAQGEGAPTWVE